MPTPFSFGGVEGNADNYRSDGFRDYSLSKSQGVVANFGYKFSPKLEIQLMLRYRNEYHNDPNATTLDQVKHHSDRAGATAASSGAGSRRPGSAGR